MVAVLAPVRWVAPVVAVVAGVQGDASLPRATAVRVREASFSRALPGSPALDGAGPDGRRRRCAAITTRVDRRGEPTPRRT